MSTRRRMYKLSSVHKNNDLDRKCNLIDPPTAPREGKHTHTRMMSVPREARTHMHTHTTQCAEGQPRTTGGKLS